MPLTPRHGRGAQLAVGSQRFWTVTEDVGRSNTVDKAETTAQGSTDKTYLAGHRDSALTLSGMIDFSTGPVDKTEIENTLGSTSDRVATFAPEGLVVGRNAQLAAGFFDSYNQSASGKDIVKFDASLVLGPDNIVAKDIGGTILDRSTARTSTGSSTSQQYSSTAGSTGGWVAHVHTFSGAQANAGVQVQHSSDDATWADLTSFTLMGAFPSQREVGTGTVKEFVRGTVTAMSSTSASLDYTVAFARR